ncbi:uncharacterized protein O3C94_022163 [Discoglossus pictus]
MTEKILSHVLEIIYLLTGEVSLLQQLTNSFKRRATKTDKKLTERILAHTLEILYLLTGEEYDIVKKDSHQTNIHQLTGEWDIDDESTLENPANRNSDLKNELVDTTSEEGEDEMDDKDVLKGTIRPEYRAGIEEREEKEIQPVEIHADPREGPSCVKPTTPKLEPDVSVQERVKEEQLPVNINECLDDENQHPVSINEEGEYVREEKGGQKVDVHSDPWTGLSLANTTKLEPDESGQGADQEEKEEDAPVNMCKAIGSMSWNTTAQHHSSHRPIYFVLGHVDVMEGYPRPINVNDRLYKNGNRSVQNLGEEASLTEPCVSQRSNTNKEKAIVYMKKPSEDTTQEGDNHQNSSTVPHNSSQYGENSLSYNSQALTDQSVLIERPHVCPECGQCFVYKSYLVRHQKSHMTEKPFKCLDCGKCFIYSSSLVKHQKKETRGKPFRCSECGECFNHKSALATHERIHRGVKSFACSECGKSFKKKSNLVYHESSHTGVKPFACSHCGKCFSQVSDCAIHETIHTGEKPFACSQCGKCFRKKSYLVCHERIHTGQKPFVCSECGKCFNQKSHLVSHERTHTGVKSFACSECGKCFISGSACNKHQRKH